MRLPFTTRLVLTCVAATAALLLPASAFAQRSGAPIVVGGTLGLDGSSADAYPGGPEIGGLVELPLANDLRLRGEVGFGFWDDDLPPFDGISDGDLRRTRLSASVIKSLRDAWVIQVLLPVTL